MLKMIDLRTQELILKGDSYQVMQVLQEMLFQKSPEKHGWTPCLELVEQSEFEDFSVFVHSDSFSEECLIEEILESEESIKRWESILGCKVRGQEDIKSIVEEYLEKSIKSWEDELKIDIADDEEFWLSVKKYLNIDVTEVITNRCTFCGEKSDSHDTKVVCGYIILDCCTDCEEEILNK
ncbi:hypothetical protein [Bacillus cereus]|uniref:hypothetical protein n=1 Tax=Bacillus cereus TaxID=1396 RepID=UPI000BF9FD50|nr:hypothetical protein [Bacillus cereus]PFJ23909.1 hypothetical protein COI92_26855 [Bacillus anthracis]PGW01295.1 hypothetical protein COD87_27790 [Bacillus cereus]